MTNFSMTNFSMTNFSMTNRYRFYLIALLVVNITVSINRPLEGG